jgi:NADPH:quinone reductase-like Zn-dependent oxidoreductase
MQAARIHAWGRPPVIETVEEPVRAPGHTLVRVDAATVSHLDLTVASGDFGRLPPLPYVPGVEGSATVLESDRFTPGTQVIFREGTLGLETDGTWRERACVPDEALAPLSVRLAPSVAATFFSPVTTAYVALHDIGRVQPGETVVVTGVAGAVGSVTAQLAMAAGAQVVGVVSREARLSDLPEGVSGVVLSDAAAVGELARTRPVDLLVDTVGGAGLAQRLNWVRSGGRAVCLGYTAGTDVPPLIFDPAAQTLTADTPRGEMITIG